MHDEIQIDKNALVCAFYRNMKSIGITNFSMIGQKIQIYQKTLKRFAGQLDSKCHHINGT
jgi:hypothetical protein